MVFAQSKWPGENGKVVVESSKFCQLAHRQEYWCLGGIDGLRAEQMAWREWQGGGTAYQLFSARFVVPEVCDIASLLVS